MTNTYIIMGPKTITWILDVLKQQGLSFILLALAIWWLNGQNMKQDLKYVKLEIKYEKCQDQLLETVKSLTISYEKATHLNTDALEANTKVLELIQAKLK